MVVGARRIRSKKWREHQYREGYARSLDGKELEWAGDNKGDRVIDWIWKLCNMTFESGVVPQDWRSAVIVPLYKGKGERIECKNYRVISLLNVVGTIYAGLLVYRVRRVTGGLIDYEQRGFRAGRGVCRSDLYTKVDR